jgi:hypothetical protein
MWGAGAKSEDRFHRPGQTRPMPLTRGDTQRTPTGSLFGNSISVHFL